MRSYHWPTGQRLLHLLAHPDEYRPAARAALGRLAAWRVERARALLLAAVLLALLPPLLVLHYRWLGGAGLAALLREPWCTIGFLCASALPPTFLLVFLCLAGLLIVVARTPDDATLFLPRPRALGTGTTAPAVRSPLQRALGSDLLVVAGVGLAAVAFGALAVGRMPGWELLLVVGGLVLAFYLQDAALDTLPARLRALAPRVLPFLLFHVLLVGLLASVFQREGYPWVWAGATALAALNLLRPGRAVPPILWVMSLALVLYTLDVDNWRYAVIGDDWAFYNHARQIAERHDWGTIGATLFKGQEAYGTHPYFSSVLQAATMKLFGYTNFGWKFSSLYLAALSVGLLYLFGRVFLRPPIALVAAVLLGASHYVMDFGKIGYNNLQALFALALVLAAAAGAVQTLRPVAFALLGVAMGLCFYVYPGGLYALPLPLLLFLFYVPPTSRLALQRWSAMGLTLLVLLLPLLYQPEYWQAKVPGTFFNNPQLTRTTGDLVEHVTRNLLYASVSFVYIPLLSEAGYVLTAYTDYLTAALVAVGLAYLLVRARRARFAAYFVVTYALMLLLVGATHDRTYPWITRMFLLLPWFALAGAVGLVWLADRCGAVGVPRQRIRWGAGALLAAIVGLNLFVAYAPVQALRAARHQPVEDVFVGFAERVFDGPQSSARTIVLLHDPQWRELASLRDVLNTYPVHYTPSQLVERGVADDVLAPGGGALVADPAVADPNALLVISPQMPSPRRESLERALASIGKQPCPIVGDDDKPRFTMWHAPALAPFCGS